MTADHFGTTPESDAWKKRPFRMWGYKREGYTVMKAGSSRLLRDAMILGRVERLMGNSVSVNPFPEYSRRWLAFNAGWFRPLKDPVYQELRILFDRSLHRSE